MISPILPGRAQTILQSLTLRRVYAVTRRTNQLIQTVRHSISAAKGLLSLFSPFQVIHTVRTSVTNPSHHLDLPWACTTLRSVATLGIVL